MIIKIGQPLAFSEQGQKDQQEDRIYPNIGSLASDDNCFVLCDGMGGHEKGEVAAEIVSKTLYDSIKLNRPANDIVGKEWFNKSLLNAYKQLDTMDSSSSRRPGTTMTCVYFAANGALCAHIGDSRIYLVRPGEGIIFRTEDHSLVNQLVKIGEITPEEAEHHPKRNVITRAMQPGLERPFAADISVVTNIKAGDYFFLCCDGILEQLSDKRLVEIISADTTPEQKLDDIYDTCFGKTRDNFTCILIPVTDVQDAPAELVPAVPFYAQSTAPAKNDETKVDEDPEGPITVVPERQPVSGGKPQVPSKPATPKKPGAPVPTQEKKSNSWLITVASVLLTLLVCFGAYWFFLRDDDKKEDDKPKHEQTDGKDKDDKGSKDESKLNSDRDEDDDDDDDVLTPTQLKGKIKKEYSELSEADQTEIRKALDEKIQNPDKCPRKDIIVSWQKEFDKTLGKRQTYKELQVFIREAIGDKEADSDKQRESKEVQQAENAASLIEAVTGQPNNKTKKRNQTTKK